MKYLVSFKRRKDAAPAMQKIEDEQGALNIARRALLKQPMEETSADLKALDFINGIEAGKARVIENPNTGAVLVFQIHKV